MYVKFQYDTRNITCQIYNLIYKASRIMPKYRPIGSKGLRGWFYNINHTFTCVEVKLPEIMHIYIWIKVSC